MMRELLRRDNIEDDANATRQSPDLNNKSTKGASPGLGYSPGIQSRMVFNSANTGLGGFGR